MEEVYTVSAVTSYLKEGMEGDPFLQGLWIKGEINNFYQHSSGHMYFTLKDSQAKIRAVMFRSSSCNLTFTPKDGLEVLALGSVSIYPPRGEYQLYVQDLKPEGVGDLFLAFQHIKKKLQEEGLFHPSQKKPLPSYPSKIGIVTSLGGAALRDILSVLRRRCKGLTIIIANARMQGEGTALSVMKALDQLEKLGDLDLVIVSRGGGSWEELWPFNDEGLARRVALFPFPLISAIGHEIDHTILDLVADLRAPTPSAAAEMAVSTHQMIQERLLTLKETLKERLKQKLRVYETRLLALLERPVLRYPYRLIHDQDQRVDELEIRLSRFMKAKMHFLKERLKERMRLLEGISPLGVLARGYAVVEQEGRPVQSLGAIEEGKEVRILLKDGAFLALVLLKEE